MLPGHSSGDPALDRQLEADIIIKLTDEGFVETTPEAAEAVVVFHSATRTTRSRSAFYAGWGGWGWRIIELDGSSDSQTYEAGSLVVDVFDAWTKQLVWHAVIRRVPQHGGAPRLAQMAPIAGIFREPRVTPPADGSSALEGPLSTRTPSMRIVFSPKPAVLVQLDGEPRYEPVIGTELQRVSNTRALIVRNSAGVHYLKLGDVWMQAYDSSSGPLPAPFPMVPDSRSSVRSATDGPSDIDQERWTYAGGLRVYNAVGPDRHRR